MSDIGNISVSNYTYTLPDDRIAKFPLEQRDASKLLLYQSGNIDDQTFSQLPDLLNPNDLLVFNNTRVIHARLLFKKLTGSVIEIFCLEPAEGNDPVLAFQEKGTSRWKALIGNAKSWKEPYQQLPVEISGEIVHLKAFMEERGSDHFTVRFEWPGDHLCNCCVNITSQIKQSRDKKSIIRQLSEKTQRLILKGDLIES